MGSASNVPKVPGATVDRPTPNPNAMKCAGCETTNRNDGRPWASAEVIEASILHAHRFSVQVHDSNPFAGHDAADAGQRQSCLTRQRLDLGSAFRNRGEAQLLI